MSRKLGVVALCGALGALVAIIVTGGGAATRSDSARASAEQAPSGDGVAVPSSTRPVSRSKLQRRTSSGQILRAREPIEDDPSRAGYDPMKLVALGETAWDLFERETRDPPWADVMEARIQQRAQRDLDAVGSEVRVTGVQCRQNTCVMAAESAAPFTTQSMLILQVLGVSPMGMVRFDQRDGVHVFEQCLVFDADRRDPDANEAWYAERRKSVLQRHSNNGSFALPPE